MVVSFFSCYEEKINCPILSFDSQVNIDTLIEDTKLIQLELNDLSCFEVISQFLEVDGKFLLYDEIVNKLFLFDSTGHFISNVFMRGQSAEEYNHIESVCYFDSLLYVSDLNNKTFVIDIIHNELLESLDYFGQIIFCETDSTILTLDFLSDDIISPSYISLFNTHGDLLTSACPMKVNSGIVMSPKPRFYRIDDTIRFNLPYDDKLYCKTPDGFCVDKKFIFCNYDFPETDLIQEYSDANNLIDFWCSDETYVHSFVPFENSTHLVLYFRNAKYKGLGIYDKRNGSCYYSLLDVKKSLLYPIVGTYGDYFVSNPSSDVLTQSPFFDSINIDNSYLLFWKLQ